MIGLPVVDGMNEPVLFEFRAVDPHAAGPETSLKVGGVELAHVTTHVSMSASIDKVTAITLDFSGTPLDLSLPAAVSVNITALPGYELRLEDAVGGMRRIRVYHVGEED